MLTKNETECVRPILNGNGGERCPEQRRRKNHGVYSRRTDLTETHHTAHHLQFPAALRPRLFVCGRCCSDFGVTSNLQCPSGVRTVPLQLRHRRRASRTAREVCRLKGGVLFGWILTWVLY